MKLINLKINEIAQKTTAPVTKQFVENIRKNGIIQPIVVKKEKNGKYKVIVGSRRLQAFIKLKKDTIPAIVIENDEIQTDEAHLILSENFARKNNLVKEAEAIKKLTEAGYSHQEIAKMFGISKTKVTRTLQITKVIPEIIAMYNEGKVTPSALPLIAQLPEEEQKKLIVNEKITYKKAQEVVKSRKNDTYSGIIEKAIENIDPIEQSAANTSKLQKVESMLKEIMKTADEKTTQKIIKIIAEIQEIKEETK